MHACVLRKKNDSNDGCPYFLIVPLSSSLNLLPSNLTALSLVDVIVWSSLVIISTEVSLCFCIITSIHIHFIIKLLFIFKRNGEVIYLFISTQNVKKINETMMLNVDGTQIFSSTINCSKLDHCSCTHKLLEHKLYRYCI